MSEEPDYGAYLDGQIHEVHERIFDAMNRRRGEMSTEQKERYFATLSILARHVEDTEKSLRRALKAAFPEILPLISEEMNARD